MKIRLDNLYLDSKYKLKWFHKIFFIISQENLSIPSCLISGKFYLYYNLASQGFWAVGEKLGSEVVRLENQGDRFCPYYLKSLWRYADGDLNALVYDTSLRAVCMNDVCSVARCGHQVSKIVNKQLNKMLIKQEKV